MSEETVDNLVIGTSHAGYATAQALCRRSETFQVLDVGYDLERDRVELSASLAAQAPDTWSPEARTTLFPPPVASARGVERRLLFGSDFMYRTPQANLAVKHDGTGAELSHALGGFGNVWGGAMLPYHDSALGDWPVEVEDMRAAYRRVLQYVPLSGEKDGLEAEFPLYSDRVSALPRTGQAGAFLRALGMRKRSLHSVCAVFGRARVAVESRPGQNNRCRSCGFCLDGCVYGSIFSPRTSWKHAASAPAPVRSGFYALEFQEAPDHVLLVAIDQRDGQIRKWKTRRLFLACGHLGTTRLIARSLGLLNRPIRIPDSQYFFFPLLSYRATVEPIRFTLAEAFLELRDRRISPHYVHYQIYGANQIFEQALRTLLPRRIPLAPIMRRLYLFQGFLHSEDSGHLEFRLTSTSETRDEVHLRGIPNRRAHWVAKKSRGLLRRKLLGFGLIPPVYLKMVPPGRSFHTGGSFPMGGADPQISSDSLGRPAGLKRVHITDSAAFPSIAGCTIAFTTMAHADRVVTAVGERLP